MRLIAGATLQQPAPKLGLNALKELEASNPFNRMSMVAQKQNNRIEVSTQSGSRKFVLEEKTIVSTQIHMNERYMKSLSLETNKR